MSNLSDVMGGRATAEFGASATLPCKLTQSLSSESLEQISWQRKTKGKPQTDNFLIIKPSGVQFVNGNDKRFRFIGNFNGTLQLNDVNLDDEGSYTCIFSLFPSGNFKTEIPLRVLGKLKLKCVTGQRVDRTSQWNVHQSDHIAWKTYQRNQRQ
uniref:Ig-like domain-containing protein n=1 Tax=Kryptolebias marmoratus TaxID=37003 RepID=A0A3Q3GNX6_KRYMA